MPLAQASFGRVGAKVWFSKFSVTGMLWFELVVALNLRFCLQPNASSRRTRAYVARRTAEKMSSKEIQRCLIHYVVREIYPLILMNLTAATDIS